MTELLNRKYYAHKLTLCHNYNRYFEIFIALGATGSSGIAGLAIWGTIPGQYAWLLVSGAASVLSVVKPVIQLSKEIERYTILYTGHNRISLELKAITEAIQILHAFRADLKRRYESILRSANEFSGLDDPLPNESLRKRLEAEVRAEIRPENLWLPE